MRFIPIECVRENSILGKNMYGFDGKILLKSGCIFNLISHKAYKRTEYIFTIYC